MQTPSPRVARPPSRVTHEPHPSHEELPAQHEDSLIKWLHLIIHGAVRLLAILMVAVILWGLADVVRVLYKNVLTEPVGLLTQSDILALFSTFLVVLIAIEIFINIILYIRKDVLPVKLVIATALMAVARKIIVFDFDKVSPLYMLASAAVVLALGITYWLVSIKLKPAEDQRD